MLDLNKAFPILFVERDSEEWNAMWRALASKPLNAGLADPVCALDESTGERWQYMGTYDGWHEFRHRQHPRTQQREYLKIESTFLPLVKGQV